MRDNLMDDQRVSIERELLHTMLPSANQKLAAPGIQLWVGLLLERGNGEKPPTVDVSGIQA